jgi:hypothetical protein
MFYYDDIYMNKNFKSRRGLPRPEISKDKDPVPKITRRSLGPKPQSFK